MTLRQIIIHFRSEGYLRSSAEGIVAMGIIFFVIALISGRSLLGSVGFGLTWSAVLTLVLIIPGYWYTEYRLKKIMAKKLDLPTFKPFVDLGFKKGNTFLFGEYKGYYMEAQWREGNPFGPKNRMGYAVVLTFYDEAMNVKEEIAKQYAESLHLKWYPGIVEVYIDSGRSKLPSQETVIKTAGRVVDFLHLMGRSGHLPEN